MSESAPVVLRSPANPTVRHLIRLRENRYRRKADRVIVDGWRETAQAVESGMDLCGFYTSESDPLNPDDSAIQRVLNHPAAAQKQNWVSDGILEKISFGQSNRGVVAEFVRPDWNLDRLALPPQPLVLVLDRIEKPGNVGAVFRCADAAGIDAVLLSDCHDPLNPNAIRNSLGAIFRVPTAVGSESQVAQFLSAKGFRVLAARVESSTPLWSTRWNGPVAVVLGSEADGLGERWKTIPSADGKPDPVPGIRIPMAGKIDSLNISVSAAVIAYEAIRQRQS
ncbi:23S rRNA (guanosine-2'-O-)-methyltransferase RlmB [Rubripirellula lacrimiformis]|uniref:23S rRNA (Guanosine-2'-O-)-methyltransferase RlmB n=1 Tax=Rubripirellula lacrimiformis TaxID=1930273 RepID=A0A517N6T4_9BACT|nr:TrmH family RNA methyltransferase [Rubripirellula lacrimiformis]QDT02847.1 23S rRNA (guanosine-2'-O-)-methyltransferase RlmB [Rubripirellula lacrimiformis]